MRFLYGIVREDTESKCLTAALKTIVQLFFLLTHPPDTSGLVSGWQKSRDPQWVCCSLSKFLNSHVKRSHFASESTERLYNAKERDHLAINKNPLVASEITDFFWNPVGALRTAGALRNTMSLEFCRCGIPKPRVPSASALPARGKPLVVSLSVRSRIPEIILFFSYSNRW